MIRIPRSVVAIALVLALGVPPAHAHAPAPAERNPDSEIIGGGLADIGEYPFMVGLLRRTVADRFQAQFCGGSLIAADVVLTAAHCVVGMRPGRLDLLIGTNQLADPGGQRIHARRIVVHPGYNPRTSGNDLALVEMTVAVADPVLATIQPGQFSLWSPGRVATVIGWGDRDRRPAYSNFPVFLYEVRVFLHSVRACRGAYGAEFIANKMLCAGDLLRGGRDSCQGDSGGPMIVPNGSGGWVQVGIVSWGNGCGLRRFPGVYTRLVRYAGFIRPFQI